MQDVFFITFLLFCLYCICIKCIYEITLFVIFIIFFIVINSILMQFTIMILHLKFIIADIKINSSIINF